MKQKAIPDLISEFLFETSRSSGPGGQNTNKVETKVTLRFNIMESKLISDIVKNSLIIKLSTKLTKEGDLIIHSQEARTQLKNKNICISKLYEMFDDALKVEKDRIPTRPTNASVTNRIKEKKNVGEAKKFRGNLKDNFGD
jgi:ribosome-associated protein